jgi:hypothetical protein
MEAGDADMCKRGSAEAVKRSRHGNTETLKQGYAETYNAEVQKP